MSELVERVNLAVIKIWQNEGGTYTDAPAGTRLDVPAVSRAAIAAVAEWLDNQIDLYGESHQVLIAALSKQLEAKE